MRRRPKKKDKIIAKYCLYVKDENVAPEATEEEPTFCDLQCFPAFATGMLRDEFHWSKLGT